MPGSISLGNITESSITVTAFVDNPTATRDWIATVENTTYGFSLGSFRVPAGTTRTRTYTSLGLPSGTSFEFRLYATRDDGGTIASTNWPSIGYYSATAKTLGSSSPPPTPPPPPPPAPSFTDQTITTTWIKTRNFSGAPDRTVAANNTTSYAIKYSSSGLNPTSWLTINSSGELSGVPAATGVYTFVITATGSGGSLDSNLQTLTINPPGNRRNDTNFDSDLIVAKRYDGAQWVNLSTFKRFDGANWVDITN
jgi:hypothetical protein